MTVTYWIKFHAHMLTFTEYIRLRGFFLPYELTPRYYWLPIFPDLFSGIHDFLLE